MLADSTWPRRSSTKPTVISAALSSGDRWDSACGGRDAPSTAFCQVTRARRAAAPVPIVGATDRSAFGASSIGRRRGGFGGDRLLRGLGLDLRDLGIVLDRLLDVVRRHEPIGLRFLGRRILGQVGFLDLRLLLGERGRGDGRVGLRTGRQVGLLRAWSWRVPGRSRSRAAPRSSSSTSCRCATASAAPPRCSASAADAGKQPERAKASCSRSMSLIATSGFCAAASGWAARRFGHAFERNQLDLRIAPCPQNLQHVHQLAIGHRAIGAQEDALVLAASAMASSVLTRSTRLTGVSPIATVRSGLMLT